MQTEVIKQAKKFIVKMKWDLTIKSLTKFLENEGFNVIFYNPYEPHPVIKMLKLVTYSKKVKAFVCIDRQKGRFVCVKDNCSNENKIHSLIHEIAHILLKHIGYGRERNIEREETEAEAFVFVAQNYQRLYCSKGQK